MLPKSTTGPDHFLLRTTAPGKQEPLPFGKVTLTSPPFHLPAPWTLLCASTKPTVGLKIQNAVVFQGLFFFFCYQHQCSQHTECCFLFGDNPGAVPPSEPPFYLFSSFSSPSPASEIRPFFLCTFWSGKKLSQSLWLSLKQPESQGLQQSYSQNQTGLVWSHPWSPWKEPQLFFLWKILPEI